MRDPVIASGHFFLSLSLWSPSSQLSIVDGFSYERVAIEAWLQRKQTSPMTGEPMASTELTANHAARSLISAYLASHPEEQADFDAQSEVANVEHQAPPLSHPPQQQQPPRVAHGDQAVGHNINNQHMGARPRRMRRRP